MLFCPALQPWLLPDLEGRCTRDEAQACLDPPWYAVVVFASVIGREKEMKCWLLTITPTNSVSSLTLYTHRGPLQFSLMLSIWIRMRGSFSSSSRSRNIRKMENTLSSNTRYHSHIVGHGVFVQEEWSTTFVHINYSSPSSEKFFFFFFIPHFTPTTSGQSFEVCQNQPQCLHYTQASSKRSCLGRLGIAVPHRGFHCNTVMMGCSSFWKLASRGKVVWDAKDWGEMVTQRASTRLPCDVAPGGRRVITFKGPMEVREFI